MNPSGTNIKHYSDKNNNPDDVYIYDGDSKYYKAMTSFAFDCLKGYQKWGVNEEEDAKDKYSVLDLFGIVQSTQKVIQDDFLKNPGKYSGMFDIFLEYVKKVNPKVIIVANALVRKVLQRNTDINLDNQYYDIFYKRRGNVKFKLERNPNYGGYTFTIDPTGKSVSFQLFFSSMLSGQRALDKGSWENLVWLVGNYLSNNP